MKESRLEWRQSHPQKFLLSPGICRAWGRESTESIEDEAENEYAPLLDELLDAACTQLDKAKGMHDELERVYRPYMDFSALTEYTDGVISSLFD